MSFLVSVMMYSLIIMVTSGVFITATIALNLYISYNSKSMNIFNAVTAFLVTTLLRIFILPSTIKFQIDGLALIPLKVFVLKLSVEGVKDNPKIKVELNFKSLTVTVFWKVLLTSLQSTANAKPIDIHITGLMINVSGVELRDLLSAPSSSSDSSEVSFTAKAVHKKSQSSKWFMKLILLTIEGLDVNIQFNRHSAGVKVTSSKMVVQMNPSEKETEALTSEVAFSQLALIVDYHDQIALNFEGTFVLAQHIQHPTGLFDVIVASGKPKATDVVSDVVSMHLQSLLAFYHMYQIAEDDARECKTAAGISTEGKMKFMRGSAASVNITLRDSRCAQSIDMGLVGPLLELETTALRIRRQKRIHLSLNSLSIADTDCGITDFTATITKLETEEGAPAEALADEKVDVSANRAWLRVDEESRQNHILTWLFALQSASGSLPSSRLRSNKSSALNATVKDVRVRLCPPPRSASTEKFDSFVLQLRDFRVGRTAVSSGLLAPLDFPLPDNVLTMRSRTVLLQTASDPSAELQASDPNLEDKRATLCMLQDTCVELSQAVPEMAGSAPVELRRLEIRSLSVEALGPKPLSEVVPDPECHTSGHDKRSLSIVRITKAELEVMAKGLYACSMTEVKVWAGAADFLSLLKALDVAQAAVRTVLARKEFVERAGPMLGQLTTVLSNETPPVAPKRFAVGIAEFQLDWALQRPTVADSDRKVVSFCSTKLCLKQATQSAVSAGFRKLSVRINATDRTLLLVEHCFYSQISATAESLGSSSVHLSRVVFDSDARALPGSYLQSVLNQTNALAAVMSAGKKTESMPTAISLSLTELEVRLDGLQGDQVYEGLLKLRVDAIRLGLAPDTSRSAVVETIRRLDACPAHGCLEYGPSSGGRLTVSWKDLSLSFVERAPSCKQATEHTLLCMRKTEVSGTVYRAAVVDARMRALTEVTDLAQFHSSSSERVTLTRLPAPGLMYIELVLRATAVCIASDASTNAFLPLLGPAIVRCLPPSENNSPPLEPWDAIRFWLHGRFTAHVAEFEWKHMMTNSQQCSVAVCVRLSDLQLEMEKGLVKALGGAVAVEVESEAVVLQSDRPIDAFGDTDSDVASLVMDSDGDLGLDEFSGAKAEAEAEEAGKVRRYLIFALPGIAMALNHRMYEDLHGYFHHDVYLQPAVPGPSDTPDTFRDFRIKNNSLHVCLDITSKTAGRKPIALWLRLDVLYLLFDALAYSSTSVKPVSRQQSQEFDRIQEGRQPASVIDLVHSFELQMHFGLFVASCWCSARDTRGVVFSQQSLDTTLRLLRHYPLEIDDILESELAVDDLSAEFAQMDVYCRDWNLGLEDGDDAVRAPRTVAQLESLYRPVWHFAHATAVRATFMDPSIINELHTNDPLTTSTHSFHDTRCHETYSVASSPEKPDSLRKAGITYPLLAPHPSRVPTWCEVPMDEPKSAAVGENPPPGAAEKIWGLRVEDVRLLWTLQIREVMFAFGGCYYHLFISAQNASMSDFLAAQKEKSREKPPAKRTTKATAQDFLDVNRRGLTDLSYSTEAQDRDLLALLTGSNVSGPVVQVEDGTSHLADLLRDASPAVDRNVNLGSQGHVAHTSRKSFLMDKYFLIEFVDPQVPLRSFG